MSFEKNVQSDTKPKHPHYIRRVGIESLRTVLQVQRENVTITHIPDISIYVDLKEELKGIHMSELQTKIAEAVKTPVKGEDSIEDIGRKMLESLDIDCTRKEIYFESKVAVPSITPVTKYIFDEVHNFRIAVICDSGNWFKELSVGVVGSSCCPCTGHQQRSTIILTFFTDINSKVLLEEMINSCNESFSTIVHTIVRTPDEKYMSKELRDNPKFVEDLARDCFHNFEQYGHKGNVTVRAVSYDSIHRHDVVAELEEVLM